MTAAISVDDVILVDTNDRPIGRAEKLDAHQRGLLHRAFSLMIQDEDGRFLLQRRALSKYHSGGLWTNTCCSHPRHGESLTAASQRRVREELGMTCEPRQVGHFLYRASLEHGLVEHELDHVLVATWNGESPRPDPGEVMDWRWISGDRLRYELRRRPEWFTVWLAPVLQCVMHSSSVTAPQAGWRALAAASM